MHVNIGTVTRSRGRLHFKPENQMVGVFWIVLHQGEPVRHTDNEKVMKFDQQATAESMAEKLAKNSGQEVFVLKTTAKCSTNKVFWDRA